MDLDFTEDQEDLRRTVREFLEAECSLSVVRQVVETSEPARALWQAMVDLDWLALPVPQGAGGLGMGIVEMAVLAEELGRCIAPVPYLPTATQLVPVIRELAATEQRRLALGAVLDKHQTGALALADHPARWSLADIMARAERGPGGSWVLHGVKHGVMAGPDVDEVAVAVRVCRPGVASVDGAEGIAVFLVPGEQLKLQPTSSLDASRPLSTIRLDGVAVPGDRALGEPGECGAGLARAIEEATVALALETVGVCQSLFDLTRQHALDRHQFGVPIGSFQAVKHKLADLFVVLARARSLAYHAVAAIAEDDPRRSVATSMAKAAADDCQRKVCQEAIQTLGGLGYTWEHDAHLYVKRAKANGALFGNAADHRLKVAADLGLGRR